jgi:hypothetical protein
MHNQPLPAAGITPVSAAGGVSSAAILRTALLFRQRHLVEIRPFKLKNLQAARLTAALLKALGDSSLSAILTLAAMNILTSRIGRSVKHNNVLYTI